MREIHTHGTTAVSLVAHACRVLIKLMEREFDDDSVNIQKNVTLNRIRIIVTNNCTEVRNKKCLYGQL